MTIAHVPVLADGEIELVTELPASEAAAARSGARMQRLRKDAKGLDELLADCALDLRSEWIAVFDDEVFRATTIVELFSQFDVHGVEAGRAVRHYVGDGGVDRA